MKHPEWALKHKKSGTELRLINNHYYLYEVSSKWNREKKRAQKITGKLLGKITKENGFIESARHSGLKIKSLQVKNYGASSFVTEHMGKEIDGLKKIFS